MVQVSALWLSSLLSDHSHPCADQNVQSLAGPHIDQLLLMERGLVMWTRYWLALYVSSVPHSREWSGSSMQW